MTYTTGLSALRANQTAMSVVGHNIANVSTKGYRRQDVIFTENPAVDYGGFSIGTGVSIGDIRSISSDALEASLVSNASQGGALATKLDTAKQLESLFLPGTGNIQERTEELFNHMQRLSALPTESTLRSAVVHSASQLSDEINRVINVLDEMQIETDLEIESVIADINAKSSQIAALNAQIVEAENVGKDAYGLRNERDVLVRDLAQLIDVEKTVRADGSERFVMGGGMFAIETGLQDMQLVRNEQGELEVWKEGCDRPHLLGGGKLAGLISQSNGEGGARHLKNQLTEFTAALVRLLDGTHATGIGIGDAMTSLTGGRRMEDVSAAMATQKTITPVNSGSLYININDVSNQETKVVRVDFDPDVHSLEDLAANISGMERLSASVDSLGRIAIVAESGYTFDFTGNLQTKPDTNGISGSTIPTISGRYSGNTNEVLTFQFLGDGIVGVTEGLQVAVIDSNNLTVRVLDVGSDYEPGSKLIAGDGVELALASGTAASGDQFTLDVVATPDETGMLAALGLNTLFIGDDPSTLAVNPVIEANPSRLATTTNGEPSDTRNLHRMLDIRDARVLRDGTVTLEQFLSDLVASVGNEAAELARDVEGQEANYAFLQGELDSVVGVDVNEELAKMLQYQRSYQAAARYLTTIDSMLQELFGIIR